MRLTLLHPAHTSIGSRISKENLPPYGLLRLGGPLSDAGHDVALINAGLGPMNITTTVPVAQFLGHRYLPENALARRTPSFGQKTPAGGSRPLLV